eukprot:2672740-Prymnesium_polylepis.1
MTDADLAAAAQHWLSVERDGGRGGLGPRWHAEVERAAVGGEASRHVGSGGGEREFSQSKPHVDRGAAGPRQGRPVARACRAGRHTRYRWCVLKESAVGELGEAFDSGAVAAPERGVGRAEPCPVGLFLRNAFGTVQLAEYAGMAGTRAWQVSEQKVVQRSRVSFALPPIAP